MVIKINIIINFKHFIIVTTINFKDFNIADFMYRNYWFKRNFINANFMNYLVIEIRHFFENLSQIFKENVRNFS